MVEDLRSWASRDERAIWQEYCGFLDLGISEFMALQEKLLREQLGVLEGSVVGKKFLGERVPSSIEEFQARVPFTRYEDYAPWLMEKREDVLPAPVFCWAHTAGTTDTFKWIPYTRGMYSQQQRRMLSWAIIAASDGYGQVNLSPGDTILYGVAPPPYISGIFYEAFINGFGFNSLPSMQDGSGMEFPERVRVGLLKGLEAGIDIFAGLSSVLVKVGESFSQRGMGLRGVLLRPKLLYKLFRAKLKSKFQNRELLPRDLWRLKSIGSYGMDTFIYRNRIEYFWGRKPTETYISTESGMISLQTWNHKGLIFLPDSVFLEFIPEEEFNKNAADPSWHPEAFCLSEVEPGARYEVVITNFHGGCLIRYRMGDFIRILSAQEREEGIPCPQMVFEARCDEIIDIAGFTRLTERVIWQSLEDSTIPYTEWVAAKEFDDSRPFLHIYLEVKPGYCGDPEEKIEQALEKRHPFFGDLRGILGIKPLKVTLLTPGSFEKYIRDRLSEGADLAHLKPSHMRASRDEIRKLVKISNELKVMKWALGSK